MNCLMFLFMFSSYILKCYSVQKYEFQPEGAKVLFMNPKYVKNVTFFSYRKTRNSPYLTDLKLEVLHTWGNNVSMAIEYYNLRVRSETYKWQTKLCELWKFEWVRSWAKEFTNVGNKECPFPPGVYFASKLELPPKNFPVPFKKEDYHIGFEIIKTSSKEIFMKLAATLKLKNTSKL